MEPTRESERDIKGSIFFPNAQGDLWKSDMKTQKTLQNLWQYILRGTIHLWTSQVHS